MDIKTCKKCGKLYQTDIDAKYCPSCSKGINELLKRIKEYMHVHSGVSVQDVSRGFEVPREMILNWIKDETLMFEHVDLEYKICERCGVAVDEGRYCGNCKLELASGIVGELTKLKVNEKKEFAKAKMRFLGRKNKGRK